jgi:2-succinyl-6-hydroxy-2,4-cyclohexadiene-1-carboxylate synthase
MTKLAVNGINYNVEVSGSGPALLLLHGFTGDVTTWDPFVGQGKAFESFTTIRVDVIGHGGTDSPADPERYTMAHAVEDLVAILDRVNAPKGALLGYSMGGRVALHLALAAPERFDAFVFESASPGIRNEEEGASRRTADGLLADSIGTDGIEAFVDRWQAQALFASQLNLPAEVQAKQRAHRLAQSPVGLANSLRGMGAGRQDYLLPRLHELQAPTLLLAGALDERYATLSGVMQAEIQGAVSKVIKDAGHAVHLEQPDEFANIAGAFLLYVTRQMAKTPSPRTGETL